MIPVTKYERRDLLDLYGMIGEHSKADLLRRKGILMTKILYKCVFCGAEEIKYTDYGNSQQIIYRHGSETPTVIPARNMPE